MRKAARHSRNIRKLRPFEQPGDVRDRGVASHGECHLPADPHRRIESGHRVLEDETEPLAPERPQRGGGGLAHRPALEIEPPGGDLGLRRQQPADRHAERRLARPALADDRKRLAIRDPQPGAIERNNGATARAVDDDEVFDVDERAHVSGRRASGSKASRMASPTRFTDMIAADRTAPDDITSHGAMVR